MQSIYKIEESVENENAPTVAFASSAPGSVFICIFHLQMNGWCSTDQRI